ncbi:hypothetical protein CVT24_007236 [Panaeolus cyanescens]|uniref:FAD-binding PCMH-type domain-containing protein n=1 Tax=Panaeolus cyanescens TaxID=181874 RepID=A0A409YPB5_9AGAR|nr:hypothetical protein CVT24_007236 [Panaeolus cyanescens]
MIKQAALFLLAGEAAYVAAVTSSDWNALNQTVGGRLQLGSPFAKPCFSLGTGGSSLTPDPTACNEIQTRAEDHVFRTQHFGAYQLNQWESCQSNGDQCMLDWTNPFNPAAYNPPRQCLVGNVPPYYIDVQGVDDVKAAIKFSKKTKVPLVIKNTGHDYKGRSAGIGSLALWTHHLNQLQFKPAFVPEKCSSKPVTAITMGAGAEFVDIYAFATQNNVTFVGGADPSVGASGGWVMGAGHGALSPVLGLGVDRVLEFKIVTADGQLRTVNKCQHPDLFFALRGGGGGTFGVVLESTHLVTPPVVVQAVLGEYNNTKANSAKLIKALSKVSVGLASDGWGGYITPPAGSAVWANPILSPQKAKQSADGVVKAFASVGGKTTFFTMPDWESFYSTFIHNNADPVGRPQVMATRIIEDKKMKNDKLVDALINGMLESDFGQILAVTPYTFKNFDKSGTSIHPGWRNGIWHVLMSYNWNFDASVADRVAQYKKLTKLWAPVRAMTPGAAVYQNEADVYEPDHEVGYWGPHYPKLLSIKKKYDPQGLFDCWHCVGWKGPKDPRYKCYPKIN